MIYRYERVTTDGQSLDAQVRQLKAADARPVLREVASGAEADRTQLPKALAQLDAGDVLMVTRLDRLARSTRDLLNTLAAVAGKKAGFKSLGDIWADTATAPRPPDVDRARRPGTVWRGLVRAKTGEGRARAVARGVNMGRKPKLTRQQQREAIKRPDAEEPTGEIAHTYNLSNSAISRLQIQ